MKNQEISNGLTIEQLEERMEFTAMAIDASSLTADQIGAAHAAGYTEADLCPGCCDGPGCCGTYGYEYYQDGELIEKVIYV